MSYSYSLNCGQYVLMDEATPVGRVLDEVSIALDKEDGAVRKHGAPEMVQRWLTDTQRTLRSGGCAEMADNLVVLTGRFPLEELNKCLTTSGYAGRLYAKALAGELEQLPMFAPATGSPVAPRRTGARP